MRKSFLSATLAVAVLTGCVGTMKDASSKADYGVIPQDPQGLIKAKLEFVLRDASTARYQFGRTAPAYMNESRLRGGKVSWYGHIVYFSVNATNGYGGYTGYEPYVALFNQDGTLRDVRAGAAYPNTREPDSDDDD